MASSGTRANAPPMWWMSNAVPSQVCSAARRAMTSIVASSRRSNDVFFQYARTPLGNRKSAADCQAVQRTGAMASVSGRVACRRASTVASPAARSSDAQAQPRSMSGAVAHLELGRRREERGDRRDGVGGPGRAPLAPGPQDLGDAFLREDERPGEHLRTERIRPERERRDDPEVAATAAQAPEQLRVLGRAGADGLARGGDEVDARRGCRSTGRRPGQPADAAAERQPGHAGPRHDADRDGQAVRFGRPVQVAERGARRDGHGPRRPDRRSRPSSRPGPGRSRHPPCRCPRRCVRRRGPPAAAPARERPRSSGRCPRRSAARTTATGCRSIIPFQTRRASS